MNTDTLIIGGGLGGLFTGALLAREGLSVTVLEKNAIAGGGLQCFRRGDKLFETGMHVMGGFQPGGILDRLCRYLGIRDRLDIEQVNPAATDEIYYNSDKTVYTLPTGIDDLAAALAKLFPADAEGIRRYLDRIVYLTEQLPMYYLRPTPDEIAPLSEDFLWPSDRFIAHYVNDPKLRELLAFRNSLYGGAKGETPAYIHALINDLYTNGTSRFAGGSQQFADALASVITEAGGEVLTRKEVVKIDVADLRVISVTTADGSVYFPQQVIMAAHPAQLPDMLPPRTLRPVYSRRLKEMPNSASAFSVYIDLKPESFRYIDHTCWYMEDYGEMWDQEKVNTADDPRSLLYMTPPEHRQGEYADRLLVHCLVDYSQVKLWEDTRTGHRGREYMEWKQRYTDRIIDKLEQLYPGLRRSINRVYSASPLTIRDYYNAPEGSIFGYRKECSQMLASRLAVRTRVTNLLLTGQNVHLHGICGVPLTAIYTAETILGHNHIVNKIHARY